MRCGYSFEMGQVIRTPVALVESGARVAAHPEDADYRGFRKNREFNHMILVTLESFLLPFAKPAYFLLTALVLLFVGGQLSEVYRIQSDAYAIDDADGSWRGAFWGVSVALTVGLLLGSCLYYYLGTRINLIGIQAAAKVMRFDLPADEVTRMVAVVAYYNLLACVAAILGAFLFPGNSSADGLNERLAVAQSGMIWVSIFMFPILVAMEMFFYRLRFLETVLAILFQFVTWAVFSAGVFILVRLITLVYAR